MAVQVKELTVEQMRRACDPQIFSFKSTADLEILDEVIGQDRAVSAVSFGIDIESPGYHMYALGPAGTGKTTTIQKFLERKAKDQPVPDDWLYVNNFEKHDQPQTMRLPAGKGHTLCDDIDELVENLKEDIPNAFETENYEKEQQKIQEKFEERRSELFDQLQGKAQAKGFRLLQTPRGILLAPVVDGEVITPEKFSELDESKREKLEDDQSELQEEMRNTMRKIQNLQQDAREEIKELDRQVVGFTVEHLIDRLKEKYKDYEVVGNFLDAVRADILKNVEAFKQAKQQEQMQQNLPVPIGGREEPTFEQYRVNLFVDNQHTEGVPVILERNPNYANLVGRIEHQAQFGALVTNYQMIKPGALHKANGGYLMVNVRDVLTKPMAWEALQRALQNREIKIESMYASMGMITTRSLEPEPIPLDVKVILIGEPMIYYLLYNLDPDFRELFKVKADFAVQMDWDETALHNYARFIGTLCEEEHLIHFAPSGVARVVEESARMVADQQKLATRFADIVDLVRQSSYWASRNGNEFVQAEDVRKAIDMQRYRSNRLEERIQEIIEEGTLLIDTTGETVGQVNGISVIPLGDYSFGKPSRITSRVFVGKSGVVNIDRETELGGKIHNKGVLILTGYLGGKFAQEMPMALSGMITFEQLYEEMEGDSASSAELYSLLSSLSGFPLRQDLAVTGSVNQRGQVQAIGGVNQKIEGFYDVCQRKGFTGEQGVLIPKSNVKNLMLRDDVLASVREGRFHVWPVETIDEGIEILTGKPAGERNEKGEYPQGSVNRAVQKRIRQLANRVQTFMKENGREEEMALESAGSRRKGQEQYSRTVSRTV